MRVSLLVTCLVDIFYPRVGMSVVEILERQGCTVDFPEKQTCCGQPAYSSGYSEETKKVAKHMIQTFRDSEYVVSPSGSCTTMIQEYPRLFAKDSEWHKQAIRLAAKTFEFTQFLVDVLQVDDVGAIFSAKATYHTSCHMTRLLGVTEAPIKLLKNVKELECIELPKKELCCGFGGTFSVKMSPISEQMVDEKIEHIEKTEADVLIGADCSCLMNIGGRIDRRKKPIEVFHIAEVLNSKGETR